MVADFRRSASPSHIFLIHFQSTGQNKTTMARIHCSQIEQRKMNETTNSMHKISHIRTHINHNRMICCGSSFARFQLSASCSTCCATIKATNHCAVHYFDLCSFCGPNEKKIIQKNAQIDSLIVISLRSMSKSKESTVNTAMDVSGSKPPYLASLFYSLFVEIFSRHSQLK